MNWQLQVKACSCVTSGKKYPDCLTCDDNLPTSRRTCVVFTVMLLKVVREAWTKSSASVLLRGRRLGQPKHKSSVDTTSRAGKSHTGYWRMQYVWTLLWFVLCNHLDESSISDLYPLTCTWMQWPSEHRQPSSAPHHSLLLPPGTKNQSRLIRTNIDWITGVETWELLCLTVCTLGLTVQFARGSGSNTWQSVSSRSTSMSYSSPSGWISKNIYKSLHNC